MAQILRQIVAGPRIKHPETGLDLVYVTDNIIAMSMPAASGAKFYYRNPLNKVVEFLDKEHEGHWAVWEFRAEGTGYDDAAFHNRVFHSPWPDHHPPPFALIPNIMASMRNHLKQDKKNVAVVHCKAGKGRTGTVTCSYLISEEGWSKEDALERFTKKRMRPQFGAGVSIPSQLRYVDYVAQWTSPKYNKIYVERSVEITEVHVWALRENVKLAILGYVDEGKTIKNFHSFTKDEKVLVDADESKNSQMVIYKPKNRVVLPTNDVCIDLEKRTKAAAGWTFISALAHCWWNCYFEGGGAETTSGVFTQEWDKMDGLRGTLKKGIRIFDKIQIIWKVVEDLESRTIKEPSPNEPVEGTQKASEDRGENPEMDPLIQRDLGLRPVNPGDDAASIDGSNSKAPSLTNSVKDLVLKDKEDAEREHRGDESDTESESIRPSESASVKGLEGESTSTAGTSRSPSKTIDSLSSPSTANWTTSGSSASTTIADHNEPLDIQQTLSPVEIEPSASGQTISHQKTNSSASSIIPEITTTPPPKDTPEADTPKALPPILKSVSEPTNAPGTPHIITASTGSGEALVSTEPEGDAKLRTKVGRLVHAHPNDMAN
ncbi:Telomerase protein component 1 [Orbilia ellipsospora]